MIALENNTWTFQSLWLAHLEFASSAPSVGPKEAGQDRNCALFIGLSKCVGSTPPAHFARSSREHPWDLNVVTCKTEHEAELRMNKKEKWDANDEPVQLWNFLDISLLGWNPTVNMITFKLRLSLVFVPWENVFRKISKEKMKNNMWKSSALLSQLQALSGLNAHSNSYHKGPNDSPCLMLPLYFPLISVAGIF